MIESRDSLGGQNSPGRRSSIRSSRILSTIFNQLRTLDRKIGELDKFLSNFYNQTMEGTKYKTKLKQREVLDLKRKENVLNNAH